jgi:RNase adapter protein RapZ
LSEPTQELMVVTGLSGSGITTATNALEDLGYFCVDGLPPPLLPKLLDLARGAERFSRLAVGLDARNVGDARAVVDLLEARRGAGLALRVVYLEASDAVLLRRFSASRRTHPLSRDGTHLPEAIRKERQAMHPFRELANHRLDTSDINVHECKRMVEAFATGGQPHGLSVSVMSFGFRHGVPMEADILWDVRFLPNPHFVPALRPFSGQTPDVRDFVLGKPVTQAFLAHFLPLLDQVLPAYEHEGKAYLTIGIGCTGGRHRSVAISERVAAHLSEGGRAPRVRHRDIDKESA